MQITSHGYVILGDTRFLGAIPVPWSNVMFAANVDIKVLAPHWTQVAYDPVTTPVFYHFYSLDDGGYICFTCTELTVLEHVHAHVHV